MLGKKCGTVRIKVKDLNVCVFRDGGMGARLESSVVSGRKLGDVGHDAIMGMESNEGGWVVI